MTIDDDPLLLATRQIQEDEPSNSEAVADVLINTLLSTALPFGIGSAITGIATELAQKRWKIRIHELLTEFVVRVARLESSIEDSQYFSSEEFQALLLEAIDQERTNRFREKRLMLAQALANSGTKQFSSEKNKETYLRIMRDLTPDDIRFLKTMQPPHEGSHATPERRIPQGRSDSAYNRMQGLGLLSSTLSLRPTRPVRNTLRDLRDVADSINVISSATPESVFSMSFFGRGFMRFVETDSEAF